MRVRILKYVFFSIIICSYEYVKNELYFINERNIYLERNIINFINNRILANVDNQFDLYDFYQSTSNIASQFSDCDDDDEEMIRLRNDIASHIKSHKKNNTLHNLNNVDEKTRNLIYKLQKELEETKRELDNIRNDKLSTQPMQDKRVIKRDENISVSGHDDFKQLENEGTTLETEYYNFEDEYNKITSSEHYDRIKMNENYKKSCRDFFKKTFVAFAAYLAILPTGSWTLAIIFTPHLFSVLKSFYKNMKLFNKAQKLRK
ncbi:fam-b protein [Plasmodium chabaudi adami]|uniref:Fam-b protein n=1 Tax=Plasmodium chabaudi adami TaxID=5826 RepID=A0A1C6YB69_PLACE|nr:fam-b protein [Plasmodium chabaudi adami]